MRCNPATFKWWVRMAAEGPVLLGCWATEPGSEPESCSACSTHEQNGVICSELDQALFCWHMFGSLHLALSELSHAIEKYIY